MIPVTDVRCGLEEEALVLEVLRSGMLAQGPMVERFETACRAMTGAPHAVAVNNGTSTLILALKVLDLAPGDEVITSAFTFVATINAILESGATVRFADVSDIDFAMTAESAAAAVNERTRALLPVHLYGQAADLAPLRQLAASAGAAVVEDAAQAHGATYDGAPIGGSGLATFSFYATKNLMAGEGGAITTDDDALAARMRILRNQGMRARYDYAEPGHNFRLTDLAAAVALPQFDRLEDLVAARRSNAAFYNEALAGIEGLVTPAVDVARDHVWHQYTLRITPAARVDRDTLVTELARRHVQAGVYYPRAVYDYPCYRNHPRAVIDGGCPVAERVADEVVSLPVHQHLKVSDREQIAAAARAVAAGKA